MIVITAGHSVADPGEVGSGTTEAKVCTDFRNLVAYYLKAASVPHVTDGAGTSNLPLAQAIKLIKPGDLAVEFHCNGFYNKTATGVETLSGPKLMKLGADLCAATTKTIGIRNRGAKPENSGQHSRLGFVQAGGLIMELFFLSNPMDYAAYASKKWVLAREVAGVLVKHHEVAHV